MTQEKLIFLTASIDSIFKANALQKIHANEEIFNKTALTIFELLYYKIISKRSKGHCLIKKNLHLTFQ